MKVTPLKSELSMHAGRREFRAAFTLLELLIAVAAFAIVLAAGPAMAHGDHDTGSPQGAEAEHGWWLDLVPRAEAAQRMEVDERQGYRFIKADGLPDHATGQFPNRGNPNRI